jgi:hypothetical protein
LSRQDEAVTQRHPRLQPVLAAHIAVFLRMQELVGAGNDLAQEISNPLFQGWAPRLSAHLQPPATTARVIAGVSA